MLARYLDLPVAELRSYHHQRLQVRSYLPGFMRSHGQPGQPGFRSMVRDAKHADTYLKVDVGLLERHQRTPTFTTLTLMHRYRRLTRNTCKSTRPVLIAGT